MTPILLILIVLGWRIKINDIGDIFELWLHGVARLHDDHDVELADVEEVDEGLELVLGHFGVQHEAADVETTQEHFYTVSLNNIIDIDQDLALKDP